MSPEVSEEPFRHSATIEAANKVLVLDDDEQFRVLVRTILEPAGFEVLESENLKQCLVELRRRALDAVILDMIMPEQDGIEAMRELKMQFPKIRIVAVSGAELSELYLSLSAHLGADASLEKSRIGLLCPLLQVVLDR